MSDCKVCTHKDDKCYCPLDKECMAFKKEITSVRHTFEFYAPEDWIPDSPACWTHCPFSLNIKLGETCKYRTNNSCPFNEGMVR